MEIEEQLDIEHEEIFSRLQSMKRQVKYIFEKYGFTIVGILTAVGTIIGVIVSNLTNGLSGIAKGLGNGLKALGKKIAQILPGMVGAIASFLFKTAGEVFGFLAKNSWLLILFVVTFAVEQYTKKGKK